jgi:hypothetical protein
MPRVGAVLPIQAGLYGEQRSDERGDVVTGGLPWFIRIRESGLDFFGEGIFGFDFTVDFIDLPDAWG